MSRHITPLSSNGCVMRTVCVSVCVCACQSRFQLHPLLTVVCEKVSNFVVLTCQVKPPYIQTYVTQIWEPPRDSRQKWGTFRPQAESQGLGGNQAPKCTACMAHQRVDMPRCLQSQFPTMGLIVPLPCGRLGKVKGYGRKSRKKI